MKKLLPIIMFVLLAFAGCQRGPAMYTQSNNPKEFLTNSEKFVNQTVKRSSHYNAEDWLCRVSQNEAFSGIYRAIIADEKVVGSISVEQKEDVYRIDGEIGFMLHGDYCNKGIMTEAVRQMCTIAFRDLPIERITANIFQSNTTSMQVLRKNGFVHEATLRNAVIKNNEIYNLCIFGLTKNYNNISK